MKKKKGRCEENGKVGGARTKKEPPRKYLPKESRTKKDPPPLPLSLNQAANQVA